MRGSTGPGPNEGGLDDTGVDDCEDSATEDEAVGEVREGNMDPRTRLALSREASFITSIRNRDGFRRGFGAGAGARVRSTARWFAGTRVMCMECGRRCLGRQRGAGNLGSCEVSVDTGGV